MARDLDTTRLGQLVDLVGTVAVGDAAGRSRDILGVYRYFLGKFAAGEGKLGGEFFNASEGPRVAGHCRSKTRREMLAKRFKAPNDSLRLVIARDMWLTGFDCPCLQQDAATLLVLEQAEVIYSSLTA